MNIHFEKKKKVCYRERGERRGGARESRDASVGHGQIKVENHWSKEKRVLTK